MYLAVLSGGDSKHHGIICQGSLAVNAYQALDHELIF